MVLWVFTGLCPSDLATPNGAHRFRTVFCRQCLQQLVEQCRKGSAEQYLYSVIHFMALYSANIEGVQKLNLRKTLDRKHIKEEKTANHSPPHHIEQQSEPRQRTFRKGSRNCHHMTF